MASINFFNEDIKFKLEHPIKTSRWIKESIKIEHKSLEQLNFIFCSDSFLLKINKEYLNHNTLTDIVTFDNREGEKPILGDIFISIDRVRENAEKFGVSFDSEIHRVIIHGVLHLIGYGDKDVKAKAKMRKKEDAYLSLRK
jgi:probable rRNA maturation factor